MALFIIAPAIGGTDTVGANDWATFRAHNPGVGNFDPNATIEPGRVTYDASVWLAHTCESDNTCGYN